MAKKDTKIECLLTGDINKPTKAHIIPKAFYHLDPDNQPVQLVSPEDTFFPKRVPKGVYDTTIVTDKGEGYFKTWDDYACKLLKDDWTKFNVIIDPATHTPMCYTLESFDYHKLKMFFISLLWRAGASSQPMFDRVQLGPHLDKLKTLILNNDPSSDDDYCVVLGHFYDLPEWAVVMEPIRRKDGGINYYSFYFGHFVARIKVDKRVSFGDIDEFKISNNKPLAILSRKFWGSWEHDYLKQQAIALSEDNQT